MTAADLAPSGFFRHSNKRCALVELSEAVVLCARPGADVYALPVAGGRVCAGSAMVCPVLFYIPCRYESSYEFSFDDGSGLAPSISRRECEEFLALADNSDGRVFLSGARSEIHRTAGALGVVGLAGHGVCEGRCGSPLGVEVVGEVFVHDAPPLPRTGFEVGYNDTVVLSSGL